MQVLNKEQIASRLLEVGVPSYACVSFSELANATRLSLCVFPESKEHHSYYPTLAKAVDRGLVWINTPQGHEFWNKIHKFLQARHWPENYVEGLPPPTPKKCSLPVVEINKEKRHVA